MLAAHVCTYLDRSNIVAVRDSSKHCVWSMTYRPRTRQDQHLRAMAAPARRVFRTSWPMGTLFRETEGPTMWGIPCPERLSSACIAPLSPTRCTRDDLALVLRKPSARSARSWARHTSCIAPLGSSATTMPPSPVHATTSSPSEDDDLELDLDEDFFASLDETAWQKLEQHAVPVETGPPAHCIPGPSSSPIGFQKANGKRLARPSALAMEQAAKRLRLHEDDVASADMMDSTFQPASSRHRLYALPKHLL